MLIMKRRKGESILIGEDIEIQLVHIGRSRVKVAIRAPQDLRILHLALHPGREASKSVRWTASVVPARLGVAIALLMSTTRTEGTQVWGVVVTRGHLALTPSY